MASFRPNRHILWKKRLETRADGWPGHGYADPVEIPARYSSKGKMASGVGVGEEARAVDNIVVEEDVRIGDLLNLTDTLAASSDENYEEVQARESVEDVSGRTLRYVCYLESIQRA